MYHQVCHLFVHHQVMHLSVHHQVTQLSVHLHNMIFITISTVLPQVGAFSPCASPLHLCCRELLARGAKIRIGGYSALNAAR